MKGPKRNTKVRSMETALWGGPWIPDTTRSFVGPTDWKYGFNLTKIKVKRFTITPSIADGDVVSKRLITVAQRTTRVWTSKIVGGLIRTEHRKISEYEFLVRV